LPQAQSDYLFVGDGGAVDSLAEFAIEMIDPILGLKGNRSVAIDISQTKLEEFGSFVTARQSIGSMNAARF
jgi:hypothetical protein